MPTLTVGRSTCVISRMVMGTWQAGKSMWVGIDDTAIQRAFDAALESGITTFDTAPAYGNGTSEKALGNAIRNRRDKVKILSKISPSELSAPKLIASCDSSLKNLGCDVIDLLQIHWPSGSFKTKFVPIEESMNALLTLKEQGKIKAIGVSNFNLEQLIEAQKWGRIDAIQLPYSLFWRHLERDITDYCHQHDITLLAYSPLAQGLLSGKFNLPHVFQKGDHRARNILFGDRLSASVSAAMDDINAMAKTKSVSPTQLALSWVLSHANTAAIVGARNPQQIRDSSTAYSVTLSDTDHHKLDTLSTQVTRHLDDNPVMWR